MKAALARVDLPDFGMLAGPPEIPAGTHDSRLGRLMDRVSASGLQAF